MRKTLAELKKDVVFETGISGKQYLLHTTWGLFSPTKLDDGTKMLLDNVSVNESDNIIDIGCGYGLPGIPLAQIAFRGEAHLVDKDFVAVKYAEKNAKNNGLTNCKVYLSNLFDQVPQETKFDKVFCNLPAKSGRELFDVLLLEARERLNEGGEIYLVAISGLKQFLQKNLEEVFGNHKKIKQSSSYVLYSAKKVKEVEN